MNMKLDEFMSEYLRQRKASKELSRQYKKNQTGLVTQAQLVVLHYLAENPIGAYQREIAATCHMDTPTVCRILDKLEKNGFTKRTRPNGVDRRAYVVKMTEAGKDAYAKEQTKWQYKTLQDCHMSD